MKKSKYAGEICKSCSAPHDVGQNCPRCSK